MRVFCYGMFFEVIFLAVFTATRAADIACRNDCKNAFECQLLSVKASHYTHQEYACDATNTPIITSLIVTGADNNGDGFKVTVMNKTNYDKYANGQKYDYFAIGETGPDHAHTCFHSGSIHYPAPVGPVYTVIYCTSSSETCNLLFKIDVTCKPPDPCAGMNCSNGRCSEATGACVCDSGYSGTFCDRNDCLGGDCENGYCRGSTCVCYSGYSGMHCTSGGSARAMVIGLISGGVVFFVIIVVVVIVFGLVLYRRRRQRRRSGSGVMGLIANEVVPQ